MTGKAKVISADPIRGITSGLPTVMELIGSISTAAFDKLHLTFDRTKG